MSWLIQANTFEPIYYRDLVEGAIFQDHCKSAFLLKGQPVLHVVDRIAGNFAAILMPVGIGLDIMQHSFISRKTPAADMFTINLFKLCLAHSHPITLTHNQL